MDLLVGRATLRSSLRRLRNSRTHNEIRYIIGPGLTFVPDAARLPYMTFPAPDANSVKSKVPPGISSCWQGGWHVYMAGPCFDRMEQAVGYKASLDAEGVTWRSQR